MSGPPPYVPVPTSPEHEPLPDWSRPQNNILISRTFSALTKARFIVDPNLYVPDSLLTPPEWDPYIPIFGSKPKPNIQLAVTFGAIDAHIHVLPRNATVTRRHAYHAAFPLDRLRGREASPEQSTLEASTTTGDITLHIEVPTASPISVRASSTFGHICLYLPHTFHGPLTITSALGTPRLSAALGGVCTPISEVGNAKRWFVGDLGAWNEEKADQVLAGTTFGKVWIGYEGEEEEAKRALRWGALQWGVNIVVALLVLKILQWVFVFLVWVLALAGII
ncbi:hypothetical protein DFH07DRAFT_774739 [Mycena maculata]|uniref:DUF7330 domain-containing protein n=1 Tax=Mycena maculata TaxID=230809 RepID=A0AAD7IVX6_9AGAR|nr:hypothetical protein DFH07DRAFT_774739 [Mycena maculata]